MAGKRGWRLSKVIEFLAISPRCSWELQTSRLLPKRARGPRSQENPQVSHRGSPHTDRTPQPARCPTPPPCHSRSVHGVSGSASYYGGTPDTRGSCLPPPLENNPLYRSIVHVNHAVAAPTLPASGHFPLPPPPLVPALLPSVLALLRPLLQRSAQAPLKA